MNYKEIATEARKTVLTMIYRAQSSHVGSNFSCIDILTVLYEKADFKKDKLIVSAGWKAATIYALGVHHGLMPQEAVDTYCVDGSKFIGLVEPLGYWGCEFAGGSVGMGIAGGVGLALAKKYKKEKGRIFVLESDGGMQPGMNWEAFLIAKQHNLNNLVVVCDNNRLQAMGSTKNILNIEPLEDKLRAFGWYVKRIDGHNYKQLEEALTFQSDKPYFIIADTIKGKGVSWMENENLWHYWHLDKEHYEKALAELH